MYCFGMVQAQRGPGLFLISSLDRDTLSWEKRGADGVWEKGENHSVKSETENAVLLYLLV